MDLPQRHGAHGPIAAIHYLDEPSVFLPFRDRARDASTDEQPIADNDHMSRTSSESST
jgi:hypothetical protein